MSTIKPNYKIYVSFLLGFLVVAPLSCKKAVEINSLTDQLLSSEVYSSDANANAAIAGIYRTFRDNFAGNIYNPTILTGLSGDDLYNFSPNSVWDEFSQNQISSTNTQLPWSSFYNIIYQANLAIEGLQEGRSISATAKNQYIGEAKFIRAYCYFFLVNLFGDIPLLTTSQASLNAQTKRSPIRAVYKQIIEDLSESANMLPNDYSFNGGKHTRAIKWASSALLARVYLYQSKWTDAENEATVIITSGNYSLLSDLDSFAIQNNMEAILQFADNSDDANLEAGSFVFTDNPSILCTNYLLNAFEPGDQRKARWIDSAAYAGTVHYFPNKYKVVGIGGNEYYTVMRLSEQYLIRAEARANLNDITGSQSDINLLRNRAGLRNTVAADVPSLLLAIEQERRTELFAETGHRWFDLKRTGRMDSVLGAEKAGWNSLDSLWPIPLADIQKDPFLTQNPGY